LTNAKFWRCLLGDHETLLETNWKNEKPFRIARNGVFQPGTRWAA